MSQHDYVIANASGASVRSDLNDALSAVATWNSGSSAPGTTYARMRWVDTTNGVVKRRNAANSAWIVVETDDESFVLSRSSNTMLDVSDKGKTIRATGSYTQTFDAVATLGDGWWVGFRVESGATLTLDPNSSETIDGATTLAVVGPASGFVVGNGSALYTVGLPAAASTPGQNVLMNATGQLNTRAPASNADDTYGHDRWYALTQANPIAVSTLTDVENGLPYMMRLTQSNASAQRMGYAQIVEGRHCKHLRGQSVTLRVGRTRLSASANVRFAVLEWTGTEDSVTSDVVNDWTSSTYTAGNFFLGSNLTVSGVAQQALTANTLTDGSSLTVTLGSSFNNLVVVAWTEGTAAQNVTFDLGKVQLEKGSSATEFQVVDRPTEEQRCERYYETQGGASGYPYRSGYSNAGYESNADSYAWRVQKRAAPTVTKNGTWSVTYTEQPSVAASSVHGYALSSTATAVAAWNYSPDSSDDTITGDCEL